MVTAIETEKLNVDATSTPTLSCYSEKSPVFGVIQLQVSRLELQLQFPGLQVAMVVGYLITGGL